MKKHGKVAFSHSKAGENCRIIPGIPCHEQKHFICTLSLNFPEMKHQGTLYSVLPNGYHENDDGYENFDFSFHYVLSSSVT